MRIFSRLRALFSSATKAVKALPPKFPKEHPLAKFGHDQLEKLAGMWVPKDAPDRARLPKAYTALVLKSFQAYERQMSKSQSGRAQIQAMLKNDQIRINGVWVPRDPILQKLPKFQRAIAVANYWDDRRLQEGHDRAIKRMDPKLRAELFPPKKGPRVRFSD